MADLEKNRQEGASVAPRDSIAPTPLAFISVHSRFLSGSQLRFSHLGHDLSELGHGLSDHKG
jgi:hypothetical protein